MKTELNEVEINGVEYVRKDSIQNNVEAESKNGMKYVIVRTYSAGVFAGYLKSRDGKEMIMLEARRLWYWSGAASLSQLSVDGVKNPSNCKFPIAVDNVTLTESIEILMCSEKAKKSIQGVPVWEK